MLSVNTINLKQCNLCPLSCGADRISGKGRCGAGKDIEISSWNLHFGEEPPVSGTKGSGTIFFTHCSLRCIFCQNYPISHLGNGKKITEQKFIEIMLRLQSDGAHNINFVTPTHYSIHIAQALKKIKGKELKIPTLYNCSGYEKTETIKMLNGLIDIYMPDAKFYSNSAGSALCRADNYALVNRKALKEMYLQAGELVLDENGIAVKGLILRHLVLPGHTGETEKMLKFIYEDIGNDIYLSLMSQYHPAGNSVGHPVIGRRLNPGEYRDAQKAARKYGF